MKEPSERSVFEHSGREKAGAPIPALMKKVTRPTLGRAVTEKQLGGTRRAGMVESSRAVL